MDKGNIVGVLVDRDDGLSTAEYAVGTLAVIGLGGLLLRLLTSEWFYSLLQGIFQRGFDGVAG